MTASTQPDLVIERIFNAPRERVFQAWMDPAIVAQWWGPTGFTTTVQRLEPRAGGVFDFTMHGMGMDLPCHAVFDAIDPPASFTVTSSAFPDDAGNWQLVVRGTVRLQDLGGSRTRLVMTHNIVRADGPAAGAAEGAEAGWSTSLDKLAGYLEPGGIVIQRVLAATPDRVFEAWTNRDDLVAWFSPDGLTLDIPELDLREGGVLRYCMKDADSEVWGRCIFETIDPPHRLVMMDSFTDVAGNIVPASVMGMPESFPLSTRITVTCEPVAGGTLMTVRHAIPDSDATGGWYEMIAKLRNHLAA